MLMMVVYFMWLKDSVLDYVDYDGVIMCVYIGLICMIICFVWCYVILFVVIGFLVGLFILFSKVLGSFLLLEDFGCVMLFVEFLFSILLDQINKLMVVIYDRVKDIDGVQDVFIFGGFLLKGDLLIIKVMVMLFLKYKEVLLVMVFVNDFVGKLLVIGQYLLKVMLKGCVCL